MNSNKNQQQRARSAHQGVLAKQSKSRRRNRRGNLKQKNVINNPRPSSLRLSPCALAYARARIDPFDFKGEAPCIPDMISTPSQKINTLVRGTFWTGTGDFGMVGFSAVNNTATQAIGIKTNAAYTSTGAPGSLGVVGTNALGELTYPYSTATRSHRTVACGLRVRYTGTELNRGGLLCFSQYGGAPTLGSSPYASQTFDTIASQPNSIRVPVTRNWVSVVFQPADPTFFTYQRESFDLTTDYGNLRIVCFANSDAGNSFEYEFTSYHEVISYGPNLVAGSTKSHSDPIGMGAVEDFFASHVVQQTGKVAWNMFQNFLSTAVANDLSSFSASSLPPAYTIEW